MKKAKSKPEVKAPETTFEIVEIGNCFELHKKVKGTTIAQKVFIQANTNYKDFKEASNKYRI